MIIEFNRLTEVQKNILCASVIADGEITKLYPSSRRINNSYREHFASEQLPYRKWKERFFPGILYIRADNYLVSKSLPLFTRLYSHFYNSSGCKTIPTALLPQCNLPQFLTVLYLDDGSLCITKSINHRKKLIYLTPHICLYLQNYPKDQLTILQQHLNTHFNINLKMNKRNDGYGHILKTTRVEDTLKFLSIVKQVTINCPEMKYKYDWDYRLEKEKEKEKLKLSDYEGYTVLSSDSLRCQNYSETEVAELISFKKAGKTHKEISTALNRTYWSVVYKLREIRKDGRL